MSQPTNSFGVGQNLFCRLLKLTAQCHGVIHNITQHYISKSKAFYIMVMLCVFPKIKSPSSKD